MNFDVLKDLVKLGGEDLINKTDKTARNFFKAYFVFVSHERR